jgi:hypothetical protein
MAQPAAAATTLSPTDPAAQIRHGLNRIPSPGINNRKMSKEEIHQAKMMETFQRERLNDFIINELQDSGCWDKPNAQPSNLTGPLHPLYEKMRWIHMLPDDPQRLIGSGVPGIWSALNSTVWAALQPVLQLATKLINNMHLWPW